MRQLLKFEITIKEREEAVNFYFDENFQIVNLQSEECYDSQYLEQWSNVKWFILTRTCEE